MTPDDLERYLHEHIPLSAAMGVTVSCAGPDGVELTAPLAQNINHRDTVFGGSASALAILAAWSLVHVRLAGPMPGCRIVIQRNTVTYDAPMSGAFVARASLADPGSWDRFVRTLERHARARVRVACVLESGGAVCGTFEGTFVAMDVSRRARG